jgi:hypothetical protein
VRALTRYELEALQLVIRANERGVSVYSCQAGTPAANLIALGLVAMRPIAGGCRCGCGRREGYGVTVEGYKALELSRRPS